MRTVQKPYHDAKSVWGRLGLPFLFLVIISIFAVSPPSFAEENASPMTPEKAEEFFPKWASLIDTAAPLEAYFKYLPDGEFEQWSYPNAEIKNLEELKAYFQATWGAFKKNENELVKQEVEKLEDGRFQIIADVNWTAVTAEDKTIKAPIRYTITIGEGTSSHDEKGEFPKVYKYQVRPIQ